MQKRICNIPFPCVFSAWESPRDERKRRFLSIKWSIHLIDGAVQQSLSYGTRFYSCAVPRNEQEHPLKQKARAMMPHSTRSLGEEKEAHDFFGKNMLLSVSYN